MRIVQLGESLIIMKDLDHSPATFATQLNQNPPPGLLEAVPAFDQLAFYFDPNQTNPDTLLLGPGILAENSGNNSTDSPSQILGTCKGGVDTENQGSPADSKQRHPGENRDPVQNTRAESSNSRYTIPALYQAEDLQEIAQTLNITTDQLIELHSQATYTVEAIGFCPGFPYLSGLPPELQNLPRRPSPRTKVEPGTIAIAGDQCCIYPLERPGGWNLISQTPLIIVDPEDDYFPLQTGDTIQFQPITKQEFDQMVDQRL